MANVCTFLLLITHISFQLNSPWPRVVLLHWCKWTARSQSGKMMVMVMNTDPGLLRRAQTRCKLVLSAATWAATKRGLGLVARRCVFRKCPSLSQRKCLYLDRREPAERLSPFRVKSLACVCSRGADYWFLFLCCAIAWLLLMTFSPCD